MAKKPERTTLYAAIYSKLRSQIFSGKFRPGDILPSENQLCAEFNASRETVRKGLQALEREGLIYSRPKIGYFVSTPNHRDFTVALSDETEGFVTQYSDIRGILPDDYLRKKLDLENNQKVIELSQITRNATGKAVAYEVKYVPYERAYPSVESEMRYAVLPDITLAKVDSFEYYTNIQISAVGADESVANALACNEGEPLLLIERFFLRQNGKCFGYSRQYSLHDYGTLTGTSGHHI